MAIFKRHSGLDNSGSANKDNVAAFDTLDSDVIEKLLNQIRDHKTENFTPQFEHNRGYRYSELDAFSDDLTKQLKILHRLEIEGFLTSEFADTILQCPSCQSSVEFSLKQLCTICRSTDIIRGSFIEHLACGNIDFDVKFVKENASKDSSNTSVMVCDKCGKRLKAIGVDYARPGIFYKCLNCKALLPELTMGYTCLNCSSSLGKDQLKELRLMKFHVDYQAVSRYFTENNLLPVVAETLNNLNYVSRSTENIGESETIGISANSGGALRASTSTPNTRKNKLAIKAVSPGKVKGLSNIEHTFGLLVSNENTGAPMLVVDLLEEKNNKDTGKKASMQRLEAMQVLAFYAKCLDANYSTENVIKKILVVDTKLSDDSQELAKAYNVVTVQSTNLHDVISVILEAVGGGPMY